jgi:8-oxo-dGTP pyrophosphatase MutT (NUDIX family)
MRTPGPTPTPPTVPVQTPPPSPEACGRRVETFEEGVVREVAEETGVTVEVERLTGAYKNMARWIVALVYRCHPVAGIATATSESVAVDWIAPADVAGPHDPCLGGASSRCP